MIDKEYQLPSEFVSNPGERFRPVFTTEILKDGSYELVQTGVEDLQELYNSQRESCEVSVLVQKFLEGDESALSRGNPVFLDLLGAPASLMEAYQIQNRAQQAFDLLDPRIRERFDNNFAKFLANAGTPEWFDTLKLPVESGVIEKESVADGN